MTTTTSWSGSRTGAPRRISRSLSGFWRPTPQLKYLSIGGATFAHTLRSLPDTLEFLELGRNAKQAQLPDSLRGLVCRNFIGPLSLLPRGLLRANITFPLHDHTRRFEDLPPGLRELSITNFSGSLDCLPAALESLECNYGTNETVDNLPPGLKRLKLGRPFNRPLDHLPAGLTHLIVTSGYFDQSLMRLPQSLLVICLGEEFDSPIVLPPALRQLRFASGSPFNLPLGELPNTLELLELPKRYQQELSLPLPPNLRVKHPS